MLGSTREPSMSSDPSDPTYSVGSRSHSQEQTRFATAMGDVSQLGVATKHHQRDVIVLRVSARMFTHIGANRGPDGLRVG